MFERYSELARTAVFFARKEAGDKGAAAIDTDHLLIAVLTIDPELPKQLSINVDTAPIEHAFAQPSHSTPAIPYFTDLPLTSDLVQVMEQAVSLADLHQCREVRTEHLFVSLLEGGGQAAHILAGTLIDKQALSKAISNLDCSNPQKLTEESQQVMSSIMAQMFRPGEP